MEMPRGGGRVECPQSGVRIILSRDLSHENHIFLRRSPVSDSLRCTAGREDIFIEKF